MRPQCLVSVLMFSAACVKSNTVNTTNNNTINNITQRVGPMGARVESPGGATADVPPGALTVDVDITIGEVTPGTPPVPALPDGETLRSKVFSMEPHGQSFALDVTLTIPHDAGDDPVELLRASPDGMWQPVPILQRFTGRLQHETRGFSFFAVVDGDPPGTDAGVVDANLPGCEEVDRAKSALIEEVRSSVACTDPSGPGGPGNCVGGWELPDMPGCYVPINDTAETSNLDQLYRAYRTAFSDAPECSTSPPLSCRRPENPALVLCDYGTGGDPACAFGSTCVVDAMCTPALYDRQPCDGALTGDWRFEEACGVAEFFMGPMDSCLEATTTSTGSVEGTLQFESSGRYTLRLRNTITSTIQLPPSCNPSGCSTVESAMRTQLRGEGLEGALTCSDEAAGGCECVFLVDEDLDETGTWAVSQRVLTFTSSSGGERSAWYSSGDGVLTYQRTAPPHLNPPAVVYFLRRP